MATVVSLADRKTSEQLAEEFIRHAPFHVVACHGLGHAFPKPPKPGGKRPVKGFTLYVDVRGWQELEQVCRDCGMKRFITAGPGEVIEFPPRKYRYEPPDGYRPPKGTGRFITRRMYAQEAYRRSQEEKVHPTGGELMPKFLDSST